LEGRPQDGDADPRHRNHHFAREGRGHAPTAEPAEAVDEEGQSDQCGKRTPGPITIGAEGNGGDRQGEQQQASRDRLQSREGGSIRLR